MSSSGRRLAVAGHVVALFVPVAGPGLFWMAAREEDRAVRRHLRTAFWGSVVLFAVLVAAEGWVIVARLQALADVPGMTSTEASRVLVSDGAVWGTLGMYALLHLAWTAFGVRRAMRELTRFVG